MQVQIKREKSVDKEEYNLLLRKVYNDETLLKHVDDVKNSDVFVPQLSCIAKIKRFYNWHNFIHQNRLDLRR
jgi:hypothetical protein